MWEDPDPVGHANPEVVPDCLRKQCEKAMKSKPVGSVLP